MNGLENQSSRWPRSSITSRKPRLPATSRKPTQSTFRPPFSFSWRSFSSAAGSSTSMPTRNSDSMPTGTLIRNTQCQEKLSVIQPPSVGPRIGPVTTTMP